MDIRVFGENAQGQRVQQAIGRAIIIDRNAREVYIERIIGPNPDRAYFRALFADDSNLLNVTANNSDILFDNQTYDSCLPFGIQREIVFDVPLNQGENHIFFTVGDQIDNKTYELVVIDHESIAIGDDFYIAELDTKISEATHADDLEWEAIADMTDDTLHTDFFGEELPVPVESAWIQVESALIQKQRQ